MRARVPFLVGQFLLVAAVAWPYAKGAATAWHTDLPGAAGNYTALLGALAMAWLRWSRLAGLPPGRGLVATLLAAAAGATVVVGHELDLLAVTGLGLIGLLATLLYQEHGFQGLAALRLPLLLLLCTVPFPGRLLEPVTGFLLDATLAGSLFLLPLFGLSPEVYGYTLVMPAGTVTLVRGCSGLDSVLLFVPLTLLLLEANRPLGRWRYAALFLLSMPLAFGANLLRVLIETCLVGHTGRNVQEGITHDLLGAVALVLLIGILFGLGRWAHHAHGQRLGGCAP